MYDIVIKGGRVIDPAQNIDDTLDVAINGDKIAAVNKDISPQEGQQLVDAKGKIVTPGLIDMHVHVFDGIMKIAIEPDVAGVKHAGTTVVDGGSSGHTTFAAFPKHILPTARTKVFCFLHLCSLGLIPEPELKDWDEVDLDAMAATIEANKNIIKGVKLRLVGKLVTSAGIEVVKTAKKIAGQFGLPIMIHIGDTDKQVPATLTPECLSVMESGDILAHVYTGNQGSVLRPDGTIVPELKAAVERGVILDPATGRNNFSFNVARRCLAQGILPTVIGTDLNHRCLKDRTFSLPVNMSKFMALGLDLKQVIAMTTVNTACAIHEEDKIGSLKPGMAADVSILELKSGAWTLIDSPGETMKTDKLLMPVTAIKGGKVIPAEPVALPPSAS
ncbi:MAG TPA: amidohydrolase/deacetylase family metallohydrolase [Dehalococcoidia bacterium]|nr:amidohydrolase/deacetylase family metallohydrolase [Dehalococcoidia bacterium]